MRGYQLLIAVFLAACATASPEEKPDVGRLDQGVGLSEPPPVKKPPIRTPEPMPPRKPAVPGPIEPSMDCEGVTDQGECREQVAFWCENGMLRSVDCAASNQECGWINDSIGHYCGNIADPPANNLPPECQGVGFQGECQDEIVRWCDGTTLQTRDCAAQDRTCGWINDEVGFNCRPNSEPIPDAALPIRDAAPPTPDAEPTPPDAGLPPVDAALPTPDALPPNQGCGDVDFRGRCDGTVVVWCDDGSLNRTDCAASNMQCAWVSDEVGNWCRMPGEEPPPDPCGDVDYLGRCEGDTAVWCIEDELFRLDCRAERDEACGWIDEMIGYYCGGAGERPPD